jgi:O-antigen ligase
MYTSSTRIALPSRPTESSRSIGSAFLAYCVALPLFGRAVFPMARDKAHITFASSFTDPQIVATYVLAAVVTIRLFTAGNLFNQMNRGPIVRMLAVFIAVCLASSVNSRLPLFSIWRSFEVSVLSLWAFVMIQSASGPANPSSAIRAFYGIVVAILIAVFIGLIINPSGAWAMEGDVARLTGSSGYSISPNDIGAIAAVIAIGCYVRAVERRDPRYAVAAVLFTVVCYVSHSRGSYIALGAGFAAATVMLARVPNRRMFIFLMSACVALAIGAVVLVSAGVRDFFVFLMTRGHEAENFESFGGRLQLWEFGLKVFREHPYLGTGYGTYPEGLEGGHFHNVFIELLVTTGMLGVFSYFAFLIALGARIRKSIGRMTLGLVPDRITAADLVTIPIVILVANGATASAAYYSWDLLGLVSVAVSSSLLVVRRNVVSERRAAQAPFNNLLR